VGKVEFGMHEKREGLVGDKAVLSLSRNVRCEEEARNDPSTASHCTRKKRGSRCPSINCIPSLSGKERSAINR
jgi:hypothetical protein